MSFKSKMIYIYRWDLLAKKIMHRNMIYKRVSPDIGYWKDLKNKHKGEAGFVICNGPSLKIDDLTKIKEGKFISIASNKIYLAFNETDWRPDYFTIADPLVWDKIKSTLYDDIKIVHIPSYLNNKGSNTETRYWNGLSSNYKISLENISDDLSKGAFSGSTVTYENIQIAMHLGLNPIYLIGCDHYYPGENNIIADKPIKQSEEKTHFIKGYREIGELVLPAPIERMTIAYEIANFFANKNKIQILNSTRGGYLDVFDRIDVDEIFNMGENK